MIPTIPQLMQSFDWTTLLDIGAVFLIIYGFFLIIKSPRTLNLLKIIITLLILYTVSRLLHLTTLSWLMENFAIVFVIILVIIFQTEIRKSFDKVRRGRFLRPILQSETPQHLASIKSIITTVETLSKKKIGALIVIEFQDHLDEYIQAGIAIHGTLSAELLTNLFWPNTPTHDGAVVTRENRVLAAGCLLPLSESNLEDKRLGTRHRAALGLSEVSDALIIVISEETGTISLAENGNITRFLNREALETRLFNLYHEPVKKKK